MTQPLSRSKKLHPAAWLLLLLNLILLAGQAVFGKQAALAQRGMALQLFFLNPFYLATMACLGSQALVWPLVLKRVPLGVRLWNELAQLRDDAGHKPFCFWRSGDAAEHAGRGADHGRPMDLGVPHRRRAMTLAAAYGYALAACLATVAAQLLLKRGAAASHGRHPLRLWWNPGTLVGYGLFFLATLLNLAAFQLWPLKVGVALGALTLVAVVAGSRLFFREALIGPAIGGLLVVLAGVLVFNLPP